MSKNWQSEVTHYQKVAQEVLKKSKEIGATQAEVHCSRTVGFELSVHQQKVESLQYQEDCATTVVVYVGKQKGEASTTDVRSSVLDDIVKAAYRIAKYTEMDEANGLVDPDSLAKNNPLLDLHHPWKITPSEAIEKASQCEAEAIGFDKRIIHSQGVGIDTLENMTLYANTHGFMEHYLSSLHTISCILVARDAKGNMQRDGSYTVSRDASALKAIQALAKEASEKTIRRLDAKRLKTQKASVIFEAAVASDLIRYFLKAISGNLLYKEASFLLNQRYQPVFPKHINIEECPYEPKGLGSAPFDLEGVAPQMRYLIQEGILQGYLLGSYSARRLGLKTTGNAGGYYNIKLSTHQPDLSALLMQMGKGLLVTEVMGSGVNLVTGDYSQGVAGFWVENGQIQYPVEEITIAGNLRDMYRNIISVAEDLNFQSKIQTGSILIESMTIAGM